MGLSLTFEIDHKDQNKLNCQRENLREATRTQNRANQPNYSNNKLGVKGVIWREDVQKYQAYIRVNTIRHHLGYFDTVEEAKEAYSKAANKHFGSFASTE
jgi:hypothetical protein